MMTVEMTRIIYNMLYSFDLPALYGKHGKCSLNMVWHPTSSLSICFKP